MKSLRLYSIPFTGLKLGKHQFEYDINDTFFDEFEYSLVKKADLKCLLELEKQETMIILSFVITGSIFANCDRCLARYPMQVDIHEQQIAKFIEVSAEENEDEEVIILTKNDHEIDVSRLIYEYINVALPLITVCGDEGNTPYCDKQTLESLNRLTINPDDPEQTDPRWDALKKLS